MGIATYAFIEQRKNVLAGSGEMLSKLFADQQTIKGVPSEGYSRRPLIGLRLELPGDHILTCKPGWVKRRYEKNGVLHLERVELELLIPRPTGNHRLAMKIQINEDGVKLRKCTSWHDRENYFHIMYTALYNLLMNPTKAIENQRDHCCCCGKGLTEITSRLRGIGPECIKYFGRLDEHASAVRAKYQYRSIDEEWGENCVSPRK